MGGVEYRVLCLFFFSSRRRHTRCLSDWSSDVCSSDLTSERNIGIDYWQIPIALRQLLGDTKAWIEYKTYPHDEIAVRFHHRLVQIHPLPHGDGRHSRFIADLLAIQLGRERFSWGRERLRDAGAARERYIEALRAADDHDISPLLAFARA